MLKTSPRKEMKGVEGHTDVLVLLGVNEAKRMKLNGGVHAAVGGHGVPCQSVHPVRRWR
jgi:hypothetical protein